MNTEFIPMTATLIKSGVPRAQKYIKKIKQLLQPNEERKQKSNVCLTRLDRSGANLLKASLILCLASLLSSCAGGIVLGGVATGAATIHDRRSVGTVIDDQVLSWNISQSLYRDSELNEASHINVTVYNNTILLSGEVASEDLKVRANAITARVADNRQIFNELVIGPPSTLLERSRDTYTTTKVKAALLNIKVPGFDATRIKTVTEAGTVYLMGLVTKAEADTATEKTRVVSGVKKVIRLFEYITPES